MSSSVPRPRILSHTSLLCLCDLCSNAYAIALFLESHPAVDRVVYPGLPSHPQHELAKRQQHGFGSMITFYCKGGRDQSAAILQNVRTESYTNAAGERKRRGLVLVSLNNRRSKQ
jgi:cystathionine beta-lyase/cystathionine gamma-synthase